MILMLICSHLSWSSWSLVGRICHSQLLAALRPSNSIPSYKRKHILPSTIKTSQSAPLHESIDAHILLEQEPLGVLSAGTGIDEGIFILLSPLHAYTMGYGSDYLQKLPSAAASNDLIPFLLPLTPNYCVCLSHRTREMLVGAARRR